MQRGKLAGNLATKSKPRAEVKVNAEPKARVASCLGGKTWVEGYNCRGFIQYEFMFAILYYGIFQLNNHIHMVILQFMELIAMFSHNEPNNFPQVVFIPVKIGMLLKGKTVWLKPGQHAIAGGLITFTSLGFVTCSPAG